MGVELVPTPKAPEYPSLTIRLIPKIHQLRMLLFGRSARALKTLDDAQSQQSTAKHHAQSVKMALTEDMTQKKKNNTRSVSVHYVFLIAHGWIWKAAFSGMTNSFITYTNVAVQTSMFFVAE